MKNFIRLLLASTLIVTFFSTIGCGSSEPTVVSEGMTDAEMEAFVKNIEEADEAARNQE